MVVVSSEIDEILAVADRILVMHRGRITGELTGRGHRGTDRRTGNGRPIPWRTR